MSTFVILYCIFLTFMCVLCDGSDIFHVKSKVTFYPDSLSDYFGYTVVLSETSLLVGAPKARSRVKHTISPGLVLSCRLSNLSKKNVTCYPLGMDDDGRDLSIRRMITVKDFFRDDMWFGATLASFANGKFLVCAPRWADPYKDKHLLANGACYVETKKRGMTLTPLKDQYRLAFKTDGARREYGEYGTHLNFYAYGQAGMSVKVTGNHSIIIGAPGLMQWTGGIIDFRYSPDPNSVLFSRQPITNPYFTKDLGPDDYFGYSVESGVFEQNGQTLYVAGAPRSKTGYGQVLIFEPPISEIEPLKVHAKVRGPQLGAYFGATLCCADINGDGRDDLLVGAPNYVKKDGGLPYDQGAVFVYLADEFVGRGKIHLALRDTGSVSGSGQSGARFGSAIADLGDIDGDGFRDIAVGAPWEDEGLGAVYIYKGHSAGLKTQYAQRIVAEDAKSFGFSISKGVDVDGNNCNDLAIGAHKSGTAYIYRCVPTVLVDAVIKVPDAMNLPQNATNFTALFCVNVAPQKYWSHVKIDLRATIIIDPEENRAMISGDSEYTATAKPGQDVCDEQTVEVKPTADLSKPISIKFTLAPVSSPDDSPNFIQNAARVSGDSTLNSTFVIQLLRDCGDDLICTPWLVMSLDSLNSVYTPGADAKFGVTLTVFNKEEPAYGAKVNLILPLPPKRVPSSCSLEGMNMTCDVPAPLERGETAAWEIELEYQKASLDRTFTIVAELKDALYSRNISEETLKNVTITVKPVANFSISGKSLPNITLPVTREKFNAAGNVSFVHYFEITNFGPSDWPNLDAFIEIPENVSLSSPVKGCISASHNLTCTWSVPAKVSMPLLITLKFDIGSYGQLLEDYTTFNATTNVSLFVEDFIKKASTKTMLLLDPATPIWPVIVGSIAGLLLLATIVYGLHKYGFFSRQQRDELKRLQEQTSENVVPDCSHPPSIIADDSTLELLSDDSDS